MRSYKAGLLAVLAVFVCGVCVSATPIAGEQPLLGASKCTWGPSYWCENFSNAKDCRATRHCIQTVWEKREVAVDNDSICQICKDMVTQARDQLRSNETEEEMKQVFEGSCDLIPIKIVKKECKKMADNFIPELIEALSSQMNPDQVCSVAGLCNNVEIDKLLKNVYQGALDGTLKEEEVSKEVGLPKQLSCSNCNQLSGLFQTKFESTNRDDMVEHLLHICGGLSSFSDACANIVLTYFNDIYDHLKDNLKTDAVCHISGVCAAKYHQHEEDKALQEPELLADLTKDDIPCELCEQLVKHLRDVLVANTTEAEFKQVLDGFCKQSRGFKDECLDIVQQYYHVIYQTLVHNLDANGACFLIGVCPKGPKDHTFDAPIMPLLPAVAPAEVHVTIKKLGANEPKFTEAEIMGMQLPIDRLMGAQNPNQLVEGGSLCTLCEYALHFIQEALATPANEDEIKHTVKNICHKVPSKIATQCDNFVDIYGDAVIALLIQGLNPRAVCPELQMCPHNLPKKDDVEVFSPVSTDEQDKPTCPLCLFAVKQAQAKIRDNKSKENIKQVLDGLCTHLPTKLQPECVDFVNTYTNELIDMLITDFKPQEICVQLKLCPPAKNWLDDLGISMEEEGDYSSEELSFNEIDTGDILFGQDFSSSPNCILCEEVVKEVEKKMGHLKTKEEIKQSLEHSCDKLKANLRTKCHNIVDKYGDKIAELLLQQVTPKVICTELGFCLVREHEDLDIDEAFKYDVYTLPHSDVDTKLARLEAPEPPTCVLCEFVMTRLESELKDKTEQEAIKAAIRSVCKHMPKTISKQCDSFINGYADAILDLITKVSPKEVCTELKLCLKAAVTDEVIECGVCHGAAQTLLPYIRAQEQHSELTSQEMVSKACESLPARYYSICSEMISIYGQSFIHLASQSGAEDSHVCAKIGKCFEAEKSYLAFARISA